MSDNDGNELPPSSTDPFEGFDWSKQDHLKQPNAKEDVPSPTPLNPAKPPSVPAPGTYYSNDKGFSTTGQRRAGTLTAFMVLEWLTFGYGCLGMCGSCVAIFSFSALASAGGIPGVYIFSLIVGIVIGGANLFFAFNSAKGIQDNLKSGIKAGYIEVTISWISIAISVAIQIFITITRSNIATSNSQGYSIAIATTLVSFILSLALPVAKTILLIVPSSRQSIQRDFR